MNFKIPRFVKWAGGKVQLLEQLAPLMPKKIERYFEPFVGSGAMAFFVIKNFEPKEVFLSDINKELINAYIVIKEDVENLIIELKQHKENHNSERRKEYYYEIRKVDQNSLSSLKRAARFIYLNRTCFNGLYRVNSNNQFNVPIGDYKNPNIVQEDKLREISKLLKKVRIKVMPFEKITQEAKKGDFIYFDPPYYPLKKTSFTTYTKDNFLEEGQTLLKETFEKLDKKECLIMESNSDTKFIKDLYKHFKIHIVKARRLINSKASGRGEINEVVITNY